MTTTEKGRSRWRPSGGIREVPKRSGRCDRWAECSKMNKGKRTFKAETHYNKDKEMWKTHETFWEKQTATWWRAEREDDVSMNQWVRKRIWIYDHTGRSRPQPCSARKVLWTN